MGGFLCCCVAREMWRLTSFNYLVRKVVILLRHSLFSGLTSLTNYRTTETKNYSNKEPQNYSNKEPQNSETKKQKTENQRTPIYSIF